MISYYRNSEIDRRQWDACVENSTGAKPYGFSWYLDIMSPGWDALIDGDYAAVFPVPASKKYGIKYVATPVFLQKLGAYSPAGSSGKTINEFIELMPDSYRLIDLCTTRKIDDDSFTVTRKANYELDMDGSYEKLREGFSVHCRRNIARAEKEKIEIEMDIKPPEIVKLFRENTGKRIRGIRHGDYQRLSDLMGFCTNNNKGRILGVRDPAKRLICGIFTTEVKGRITMLFVANSQESRKKRIGYHIVNELIKESAGTGTILDFAGSSIPSIASFMESFGSKNIPFYRNYCNRLPWPVRLFR
ncbi:MAG: hypothetical protein GX876_05550 [Bacteroidales bacterium]|nr:hypothetical protein [Bacteroidales bacterium]